MDASVDFVCFDSEEKRTLTGGDDCTIRVWDIGSNRETLRIKLGSNHYIGSLQFSPDGSRILATSDGGILNWDATTGALLGKLDLTKQGWIRTAVYSPDGRRILAFDRENTLRIWRDFPTDDELLDFAKEHAPQALTMEQRQQFYCTPHPPRWCIERELWPFDSIEARVRALGRGHLNLYEVPALLNRLRVLVDKPDEFLQEMRDFLNIMNKLFDWTEFIYQAETIFFIALEFLIREDHYNAATALANEYKKAAFYDKVRVNALLKDV
ncbi:MAG: hypothetical protein AB2564_13890 [Candidatus Thiodiazotropha sp.]